MTPKLPPTTHYLCSLHSITGSADLAVVTLTLMLYTISLHIAASAGTSHVRYSSHLGRSSSHNLYHSSGRLFLEFYMPFQQLEFLP
jgi:hypothetical protein